MFTFSFTVDGLTREQVDALMKFILLYAEVIGAEVGGGYGPTEPEVKDNEQKTVSDTDTHAV